MGGGTGWQGEVWSKSTVEPRGGGWGGAAGRARGGPETGGAGYPEPGVERVTGRDRLGGRGVGVAGPQRNPRDPGQLAEADVGVAPAEGGVDEEGKGVVRIE